MWVYIRQLAQMCLVIVCDKMVTDGPQIKFIFLKGDSCNHLQSCFPLLCQDMLVVSLNQIYHCYIMGHSGLPYTVVS